MTKANFLQGITVLVQKSGWITECDERNARGNHTATRCHNQLAIQNYTFNIHIVIRCSKHEIILTDGLTRAMLKKCAGGFSEPCNLFYRI
jgi:hypothetical protein